MTAATMLTAPAAPEHRWQAELWVRDVPRSCSGCRYQTTGARWVRYYVNPYCPWHGGHEGRAA